MKVSVKKYLLYSSVFAIFTEAFLVKFIIDWKLIYLIIFTNFILLVSLRKLKINFYFFLMLCFFLVHGILTYTVIGIPYNYLLSQIIGLSIMGTYYYNFIPLYDKEDLIRVYVKSALYVAVAGYILWALNINLNDGIRLQSIFTEPAHYAIVTIPACYYYLRMKQYINFLIIFGTLIMSNSSLGYVGCALMFILPNLTRRRIIYLIALVPFLAGTFYYVYNELPFFKMRIDDTYTSLNAVNTGKFEEYTNLSSYALLSNLFVARHNIADHPLGSGLGSHYHMHGHYLKEIRVPPYIRATDNVKINAADACSMFTRLWSDFGYIGIISVLFALYYGSKSFLTDFYFAQGVFIYLILKFFRDGHYFPPEMFFFFWLLYFYIREYIASKRSAALPN
ncbi:MAG TPA: hypothetical protein VGB44_00985 [Flavobacterium sp.]